MTTQINISISTKNQLALLRTPFEEDDALLQRLITAYNAMLNEKKAIINNSNNIQKDNNELHQYGQVLRTFSTRQKPFAWSLKGDVLTIYRPELAPLPLKLQKLLDIIKDLNKIYLNNYFMLDNNITDVMHPRPDLKTGFGRMIYKHTQSTSTAQISSQLGPLLYKYGILEWNRESHGIGFKCSEIVVGLTVEKLQKILTSEPA